MRDMYNYAPLSPPYQQRRVVEDKLQVSFDSYIRAATGESKSIPPHFSGPEITSPAFSGTFYTATRITHHTWDGCDLLAENQGPARKGEGKAPGSR